MAGFFDKLMSSSNFSTPSHPVASRAFQQPFPHQYSAQIPRHVNAMSPYQYGQHGSLEYILLTISMHLITHKLGILYETYDKLLERVGPAGAMDSTTQSSVSTPPNSSMALVPEQASEVYLSHEDGAPLSKLEATEIQATARSFWQSLCKADAAPGCWGDASTEILNMHPLLALCEGHWKVNTLASQNYSSWSKNHLHDGEGEQVDDEDGDDEVEVLQVVKVTGSKQAHSSSPNINIASSSKKQKANLRWKSTTKSVPKSSKVSKLKSTNTVSHSATNTAIAEPNPSSADSTPQSPEVHSSLSAESTSLSSTEHAPAIITSSSSSAKSQETNSNSISWPQTLLPPSITTSAMEASSSSLPTPSAPNLPQASTSTVATSTSSITSSNKASTFSIPANDQITSSPSTDQPASLQTRPGTNGTEQQHYSNGE
ncbi:hypothetical protein M422DRAFT_46248 [Sphaerobolus stellatus SS14]|uniref:Uncharacterized protein n=1 Tax=Sphaerobolus stellatus (strain SS14) TaxID=990650 RepID=A0A0C9VGN1_SPHS4|nr:hypothetical protein M422DRAFT_46248 [Sphaerobolus stellatus SS14]